MKLSKNRGNLVKFKGGTRQKCPHRGYAKAVIIGCIAIFFGLRRFGLHDIVDLVNRHKNSEFKGKQAILSTWNSEIKQNQGNPSGLE